MTEKPLNPFLGVHACIQEVFTLLAPFCKCNLQEKNQEQKVVFFNKTANENVFTSMILMLLSNEVVGWIDI